VVGRQMVSGEDWRKSSYSADGPNCVEVARKSLRSIVIRDSRDVDGLRLAFSMAEWREFTHQIKSDDL
jgi:hypothetical protein